MYASWSLNFTVILKASFLFKTLYIHNGDRVCVVHVCIVRGELLYS